MALQRLGQVLYFTIRYQAKIRLYITAAVIVVTLCYVIMTLLMGDDKIQLLRDNKRLNWIDNQ